MNSLVKTIIVPQKKEVPANVRARVCPHKVIHSQNTYKYTHTVSLALNELKRTLYLLPVTYLNNILIQCPFE